MSKKSITYNIFVILIFIIISCKNENKDNKNIILGILFLNSTGYQWNLPTGFPTPNVPSENPMSQDKVNLGRFLFYDTKLSSNQTQSCSSCHIQSLAFSDGKTVGIGSTGELHPRNPQHLSNVAYHPVLTWNNPQTKNLESQSSTPLFGENPIELGLSNDSYLEKFRSDSIYKDLFFKAFGGGQENINEKNIRYALASFQRTLISGNSPYDKYVYQNQKNIMSASAIRGLNIFNGETAECFHCHGGFNFTDTASHTGIKNAEIIFNDNGNKSLTNCQNPPTGFSCPNPYSSVSDNKKGLYEITRNNSDIGKFRAPSLRNVGLTYPYMHDGSFQCDNPPGSGSYSEACARNALGKVIDHYMRGGLLPSNKDTTLIRSFSLSQQEKNDLIEFLMSLTDQEFISNSSFSNPFK